MNVIKSLLTRLEMNLWKTMCHARERGHLIFKPGVNDSVMNNKSEQIELPVGRQWRGWRQCGGPDHTKRNGGARVAFNLAALFIGGGWREVLNRISSSGTVRTLIKRPGRNVRNEIPWKRISFPLPWIMCHGLWPRTVFVRGFNRVQKARDLRFVLVALQL